MKFISFMLGILTGFFVVMILTSLCSSLLRILPYPEPIFLILLFKICMIMFMVCLIPTGLWCFLYNIKKNNMKTFIIIFVLLFNILLYMILKSINFIKDPISFIIGYSAGVSTIHVIYTYMRIDNLLNFKKIEKPLVELTEAQRISRATGFKKGIVWHDVN